jgi:hypothetical protein
MSKSKKIRCQAASLLEKINAEFANNVSIFFIFILIRILPFSIAVRGSDFESEICKNVSLDEFTGF